MSSCGQLNRTMEKEKNNSLILEKTAMIEHANVAAANADEKKNDLTEYENVMLQQTLVRSMEDPATSLTTRDTDMSGAAADDQNLVLALQLPVQNAEKDSISQIYASKLLTDQAFVSFIFAPLLRVDFNDPSVKDLLPPIQSESKSQQKKNEGTTPDEEDR